MSGNGQSRAKKAETRAGAGSPLKQANPHCRAAQDLEMLKASEESRVWGEVASETERTDCRSLQEEAGLFRSQSTPPIQ